MPRRRREPCTASQTIVKRLSRRLSVLGPSGSRGTSAAIARRSGVRVTSWTGVITSGAIRVMYGSGITVDALSRVRTRRVATWRGTVMCSPAG